MKGETLLARRHSFTVDEYYRMAKDGILSEDDRVELIEGEIVEMAPIGPGHSAVVQGLNRLLAGRLNLNDAFIRIQDAVRLNARSEPQPDVAIVRFREDLYRLRHPGPDECLLVIEVADSSLTFDLDAKAPLYGKAGIPELWVVSIPQREIHVFLSPGDEGYEQELIYGEDDLLHPTQLPPQLISAREILDGLSGASA